MRPYEGICIPKSVYRNYYFFSLLAAGKIFLRMNTILNQRLSCHTVHVTQNLKTLILIEEL